MKKISEIMDELGFTPEGSPAVKEAFVKYLVRASEGTLIMTPTEKELIKANPDKIKPLPRRQKPEQLSFNFEEESLPRSKISHKASK